MTSESIDTGLNFKTWLYDLVLWIFQVTFNIFFREILSRGAFRIPKSGPVIFVGAPHANQFVDPMLLMQQAKGVAGRRLSFLIAETSLRRKFIGAIARATQSIGVVRAQDNLKPGSGKISVDPNNGTRIVGEGTKFTAECMVKGIIGLPQQAGSAEIAEIVSDTELILRKEFKGAKAGALLKRGTSYKRADHVDQSKMYRQVFEHLHDGGCIGIFPEGGSHDRTDLLPLKAGVAIMALGAISEFPNLDVKIVPCGMNYFHPNKFRSRAVIEFGSPMTIPRELVEMYKQGGDQKRDAVKQLLDHIADGLRTVTVTTPDYETLMVVQAARRLYRPPNKKLPLPVVVELNRRLIRGYEKYKDDPKIVHLRNAVLSYNKKLKGLGLKDHQVETATLSPHKVVFKFLYRLSKLLVLAPLAMPGAIMFSPVFVATKLISRKRAKQALAKSTVKVQARDVVATWKVLVAMGLAPLLYTVYALVATYICYKKQWVSSELWSLAKVMLASYIVFPAITWSALVIGETGMDIFKSLRPLALALNPFHKNAIEELRETRRNLVMEVSEVVNSLGPELYPDFGKYSFRYNEYQNKEEKLANGKVEEGEEVEEENEIVARRRTSSASTDTNVSSDSHSISRVNSESGLANIPLFSNVDPVSNHSRASSGSSVLSMEVPDTTTATGQKVFQSEVSKRIRGAMEERIRARMEESDEE
uniref:ARAD1D25256p n=1 Tax=Blastobotrys adeninivorans TaxID=409370 RepID=A0A060TGR1_BLAAD